MNDSCGVARSIDLKVEVKHTLKLDREDLFIPPRQFGQPVVGEVPVLEKRSSSNDKVSGMTSRGEVAPF